MVGFGSSDCLLSAVRARPKNLPVTAKELAYTAGALTQAKPTQKVRAAGDDAHARVLCEFKRERPRADEERGEQL